MNAIVTDPPFDSFFSAYDKAIKARRIRLQVQAQLDSARAQELEAVKALEAATAMLRDQPR